MQKSLQKQKQKKLSTTTTTKPQQKRKISTVSKRKSQHTTTRRRFTTQVKTDSDDGPKPLKIEDVDFDSLPAPPPTFNIPLNEPIPSDFQLSSETTRVSTKPRVTTLKNGIKVITQDSTFPVVYVNARVAVGAIHEAALTFETGYTAVLARVMSEHINQLTARMVNGTDVRVFPTRDNLDIHASTVGSMEDALIPVWSLVTSQSWSQPDIVPHVKEFFKDYALPSRNATPAERFDDDIHHNVFYGKALAQRTSPDEESLKTLDANSLKLFQKEFFTANRITLSAVGIDHDEFVNKCDELFGDIQKSKMQTRGDLDTFDDLKIVHSHQYLPDSEGQIAPGAPDPNAMQHVALAWHGPDVNSPFLVPMTVLSSVIGNARSFTSGGPGKGLHARATTHLLGPRRYVDEVAAFFYPYPRTSVFGLQGVVQGNKTNKFIDEMLDELTSMADTITDVEVERAKNQLKRQLFAHHEKASMRVIELARHSAVYGKWKADEFIDEIDKVTTAQVKQSAKLIFDADAVLITTLGNPRNVAPKWFSRPFFAPNRDEPFTQKELDDLHDSQDRLRGNNKAGGMSKLKEMFGF